MHAYCLDAKICAMVDSMELTRKSSIVADFFLDGAKIIFGSLVVGAFVPGATGGQASWLTIGIGILWIITFLIVANIARKKG